MPLSSHYSDITLNVAPPTVATFALVLRGISRVRSEIRFGWDDFFVVGAVCAFWAESAIALSYVLRSATSVAQKASFDFKLLYIGTPLTVAAFSMAKLSILCFYKRVFSINPNFNLAANILIGVSSAWWITTTMLSLFRCRPIAAGWDPVLQLQATCLNFQTAFLITETINCITEVIMVILPIYLVRQLRLPLRFRIGVSVVLAVGFFTAITSAVRIAEVYSPAAGSVGILKSGLWGSIQMCTGICCACMPTYRGLLPKHWEIIVTLQRRFTGLLSRTRFSRRSTTRSDSEDVEQRSKRSAAPITLNRSAPSMHKTTFVERSRK